MWYVSGNNLQMAEGDYGIQLPVSVDGATLTENDSLRFIFKDKVNGETLLTKEYTSIVQNTVNLELTEEESAIFPVGGYVYSLDWYQEGNFMCNIITSCNFKVVDKA